MRTWVAPRTRYEIVEFVAHYSEKTDMVVSRLIEHIGVGRDRFYLWRRRYGHDNYHNASLPRNFWLEDWERQRIIAYYLDHPREGYRRLTYRMLDADIVAVSPSSTYRVLKNAGLIGPSNNKESKKGTGFKQPSRPHKHWNIDVS